MKPIAIFSYNSNSIYEKFADPISRSWENLGFESMCLKIDESNCWFDDSEIPFGNQAQMIRLLLPAMHPDRIFITTDIDMLPLNAEYFNNSLEELKNNEIRNISFDAYRNRNQIRFPVCYFIGYGSAFSLVNKVKNIQDLKNVMKTWWSKNLGWDTDELCFSDSVVQSVNNESVIFSYKNRGWTNGIANMRIDRDFWRYNKTLLNNNQYIDSHLLRPFDDNKDYLLPLFESIGVKL